MRRRARPFPFPTRIVPAHCSRKSSFNYRVVASPSRRRGPFVSRTNSIAWMPPSLIFVCQFSMGEVRRTKGAIKLHLLLDHDGCLPCFGILTDGKTHEIRMTRTLQWPLGSIVVRDRDYLTIVFWTIWRIAESSSSHGIRIRPPSGCRPMSPPLRPIN
jgi:hypothetical protein